MAFQAAPDMAEAVIHWIAYGQDIYNVLNFKYSAAYDQGEIDNLAFTVDAAVDSYWLPLVGTGVTYIETVAKGLANAADLTATSALGTANGSASGTQLANNLSYVVTLKTALTGRSYIGRTYMPPTVVANTSNPNEVTTTYADNCVDAIANTLDDLQGQGWTGVILSRITGGAPRATAVGTPITTIAARNVKLDHQNGRLAKGH